jgi:hypothetical protein
MDNPRWIVVYFGLLPFVVALISLALNRIIASEFLNLDTDLHPRARKILLVLWHVTRARAQFWYALVGVLGLVTIALEMAGLFANISLVILCAVPAGGVFLVIIGKISDALVIKVDECIQI